MFRRYFTTTWIEPVRYYICDGFGTHETLEVLEFCFENNIILCRLPSHTSHTLQPCDISVFGPLKAAYRDQVDRLERGNVGTIGKEHFTYLYQPAREQAFTARNIGAGWAKAGLFPFNPERVLNSIPGPTVETAAQPSGSVEGHFVTQGGPQTPTTPTTLVSAEALALLHELIRENTHVLDETSRQRVQRRVQKLTNATQLSFAERAFLQERNEFLASINNEAKVRRATKSKVIGTARVMSYEDLENARAERCLKDAEQEAKRIEREAKKDARIVSNADEDILGKGKRGRNRKVAASRVDTSGSRPATTSRNEIQVNL